MVVVLVRERSSHFFSSLSSELRRVHDHCVNKRVMVKLKWDVPHKDRLQTAKTESVRPRQRVQDQDQDLRLQDQDQV